MKRSAKSRRRRVFVFWGWPLPVVLLLAAVPAYASVPSPISTSASHAMTAAAECFDPHLSDDGRFVAFVSAARNLATGDLNDEPDVFVRDREWNGSILVSVRRDGTQSGNGASYSPSMSADGRRVAFESWADDLVSEDNNATADVFVRKLTAGVTELVSVSDEGAQGNGSSSSPMITADGRFVLFVSEADNLVPDEVRVTPNLYVRDLETQTTRLATPSVEGGGTSEARVNSLFSSVSISDDGRYVVFVSDREDLVPGDDNGVTDVFLRDMEDEVTILVSQNPTGFSPEPASSATPLTAGRYIVFQVVASESRLFLFDLESATESLRLIPVSAPAERGPWAPILGGAGSSVLFVKWESHPDTNNPAGMALLLSLHDTATEDTSSIGFVPGPPMFHQHVPDQGLSDVMFDSPGDTILYRDWDGRLLMTNRLQGTETVVTTNSVPGNSAMTPDARFVVFQNRPEVMVPDNLNTIPNLYLFDAQEGTTELVSQRDESLPATTGNGGSRLGPAALSTDGSHVAFATAGTDLAPWKTNQFPTSLLFPPFGGGNIPDFADSANLPTGVILKGFQTQKIWSPGGVTPYARAWRKVLDRWDTPLGFSPDGRLVSILSVEKILNSIDPENAVVQYDSGILYFDIIEEEAFLGHSLGPMNLGPFPPPYHWSRDAEMVVMQVSTAIRNGVTITNAQVWHSNINEATNRLVSRTPASPYDPANGSSILPEISPDGRFVIYLSDALNIVSRVLSGTNAFLWDAESGMNTVVRLDEDNFARGGVHAAKFMGAGRHTALSVGTDVEFRDVEHGELWFVLPEARNVHSDDSGQWVAFESASPREVPDENGALDVFLIDSDSQNTTVVSLNQDGTRTGNGPSFLRAISPDGRHVVFESLASDLVSNDANGHRDVFLWDRLTQTTTLLSLRPQGGSGNSMSINAQMSADGSTLVFESYADDLTEGDYNRAKDLFMVRLSFGDSDDDGLPDDWEMAFFGDLSRDGSGDWDGDGLTDREEHLAGTDPTNEGSVLRVITLERGGEGNGGGVTILWQAVPGKLYQVEYKDDMNESEWSALGSEVVASSETGVAVDESEGGGRRFYRVRVRGK